MPNIDEIRIVGQEITYDIRPKEDAGHQNVSAEEKAAWNAKSDFSGKYADLQGKPDLTQFVTKVVDDLTNYYLKSDTYTKQEVQQLLSSFNSGVFKIVDTLQTASAATAGLKIYLVPSQNQEAQNVKDEFITIEENGSYRWEQIGSTAMSLDGYVTETTLNQALSSYVTSSDFTSALAQKQDVIPDLSSIRSGAAAGATAVQPAALNAKQDTIADLSAIRSGAALGSTSVQPADIENMVEAEPIGSIIPPVNPSEFATKEELSKLGQEVTDLNDENVFAYYREFSYKTVNGLRMQNGGTITANNNRILYYVPIKAGQVFSIHYSISSGYIETGISSAIPVVGGSFTQFGADTSTDTKYRIIAESDGYLCASFVATTLNGPVSFWSNNDGFGGKVKRELDDLSNEMHDVLTSEVSVNLFDKTKAIVGFLVRRTDGKLSVNPTNFTTDFLPIDAEGVYADLAFMGGSYFGFACYDSSKTYTHGGGFRQASYVSGDAFVRFSGNISDLDVFMAVKGTSADYPLTYQHYGKIGSLKQASVSNSSIKDGSVSLSKFSADSNALINQKVPIANTGNLFTTRNLLSGFFINSNGTFAIGGGYGITDFIPVKAETTYYYSSSNNAYPGGSGYINYYDSAFGLISTSPSLSKTFTTPNGCAYIRVSLDSTINRYPMINEGIARGQYVKNSPIDGFPEASSRFANLSSNEVVANGATVTGEGILSNRNFFAAFEIIGTGPNTNFTVGFGKGSGDGAGAIITGTNIYTIKGKNDTQVFEYTHGLTLGYRTRVVFSRDPDGWVNITLFDNNGGSYSGRNKNPHIGLPYVTNNTGDDVTVRMSQASRDSNKPIIVCGDSYWSVLDPARIPYHLDGWGYTNYELLASPGISGQDLLPYLKAVLNRGARPKYVIWDMGMNGGADTDGAVNSNWLSAAQEFIDLCLQCGVTPILCTIPTIPSASHLLLNAWVGSSGFRYIDFSAAVIADDAYWRNWGTDDALLGTDQVHPTTKGATVLAERILLDFPEIAIL